MGLFDFFSSKGGGKGSLRKQAQRLTEKYGPPDNRQKVIQQLADMGSPEALSVLCMRFTIRADPGITDDEEKESVRSILVDAGEKAVEPVKEFLEAQDSGVSWGLRVLSELRPAPDVVATVLRLLHRLGREYTRDPEKKLVLLSWLAEQHGDLTSVMVPPAHPEPAVRPEPVEGQRERGSTGSPRTVSSSVRPEPVEGSPRTVSSSVRPEPSSVRPEPVEGRGEVQGTLFPLLEDFSDDVRIAAVRVIARQPLTDRTRSALIELFLRDKDNARVRGEVLAALAELGANVKGYRPSFEPLVVEPYYLDKESQVKRRA